MLIGWGSWIPSSLVKLGWWGLRFCRGVAVRSCACAVCERCLQLGSTCGVNGCSWLAGCVWCCAWVAVVQQIHDSVDGIEAWQCRIWCELGDRSSSEMMALVWGELVVYGSGLSETFS
ncbi:hypothetical protein ACOSQ3_022567 [Xanthoceras sorbifolium]